MMRFTCRFLPLAVVAFVACGERAPIVIGAPGDWEDGRHTALLQGMELAVEEVNRAGGAGGRRLDLELPSHDHQDLLHAVRIAEELAARDEVVAITGHTGSASTASAMAVYRGRVPAVLPLATSSMWDISPAWSFTLSAPAAQFGAVTGRLAERFGWRRVVMIFDNTPHARASAAAVAAVLGDTILLHPVYTEATGGSYAPVVESIIAMKPQAIILAVGDRNAPVLVPLIRALDPGVAIVGDPWPPLIGSPALRGAYIVDDACLGGSGDISQVEFAEAFEAAYGRRPTNSAAFGYEAIMLIAGAIEAAGPDREAIHEWLLRRTPASPARGPLGEIAFDRQGHRAGDRMAVYRVDEDDRIEAVEECDR